MSNNCFYILRNVITLFITIVNVLIFLFIDMLIYNFFFETCETLNFESNFYKLFRFFSLNVFSNEIFFISTRLLTLKNI